MLKHIFLSMNTLGARIAFARKELGLSQVELASAVGVRQLAVLQWEHDRTIPRADILFAVARRLGKPIEWFAATPVQPDEARSHAVRAG